jgi:hypothetical protein
MGLLSDAGSFSGAADAEDRWIAWTGTAQAASAIQRIEQKVSQDRAGKIGPQVIK